MSETQKIKLLISYDGTDFCGWQRQKDHKHGPSAPSIQETLEKALEKLFNHPINVSASGRTDAGVHALAQVCHFEVETSRKIPRDLCWALKAKLPPSITAKAAYAAPREFHATLSAVNKTYRYWVWNSDRGSALLHRYSWWIRNPLDLDRLNQMSQHLLGKQDFASFRSMGTPVKHTVREIYEALWWQRRPGLLEFKVTGNGFMKQMVRNMVGSQVDIAWRGQPVEKIKEMIAFQDRTKSGPAAPPQGLFLERVRYPKSLDRKCRRL